jgi:hypothetical protein
LIFELKEKPSNIGKAFLLKIKGNYFLALTRKMAGSHYVNLLDVRIRVIIVRFYKSPCFTGVVKASQRLFTNKADRKQ